MLKKRLEGRGLGAFDQQVAGNAAQHGLSGRACMRSAFIADMLGLHQRLVHAGRILGNDETLLASGVAKSPQVRAVLPRADSFAARRLVCRICI